MGDLRALIDLQVFLPLILFIAPGFLYSRAYLAARPRYQKTPDFFQQIVLAVVASTAIHSILIGIPAVVALLVIPLTGSNPVLGNIPPFNIDHPQDIPIWLIASYSLIVVVYVAVSLILANKIGWWLGGLPPERLNGLPGFLIGYRPAEVLLWYTTLVEEPLRQGILRPRLLAWLRSGESFEGNLVELRLSAGEVNVLELALDHVKFQPALAVGKSRTTRRAEPTPLPQHRVLLRSNDILWLARIDPEK